jgi:hypothetical protein
MMMWNSKVAGFAKWVYPHSEEKEEGKTEEGTKKHESAFAELDAVVLPAGVDRALFNAMMRPMVELGEKYADASKYCALPSHPSSSLQPFPTCGFLSN